MSETSTRTDAIAAERAEARRLMVSGIVIGGLDLLALGALGVSCPLCVVGAPALVGWGAYRWLRARRQPDADADQSIATSRPITAP